MDLPRGRFDLVSKSWDISLNESIEICSGVNVRGVPVVLNGCSVADLSAPIFRKRFVLPNLFYTNTYIISLGPGTFMVPR